MQERKEGAYLVGDGLPLFIERDFQDGEHRRIIIYRAATNLSFPSSLGRYNSRATFFFLSQYDYFSSSVLLSSPKAFFRNNLRSIPFECPSKEKERLSRRRRDRTRRDMIVARHCCEKLDIFPRIIPRDLAVIATGIHVRGGQKKKTRVFTYR